MVGDPPRFADDEAAITILHLSDLQFGRHHRFADASGGFDTLLRRLCDDLDLLREQNGLQPDLIALTGDLSEWGMRRELEQVAAFGEGVLAHLQLAPERLLVVPGNHDINRNLCEARAGPGAAARRRRAALHAAVAPRGIRRGDLRLSRRAGRRRRRRSRRRRARRRR
jgi:3',5'-cyclic AMP phosphodiesterase CpdA